MALSSTAQYVPTINEFLPYWTLVNASLGAAGPFVLPGVAGLVPAGFDYANLEEWRDTLQDELYEVQAKLNDQQIAAAIVAAERVKLYRRFTLFLEVVDGFYAGSPLHNARPEAPGVDAGEGPFLDAMRDAHALWVKLNASPAPAGLTLPITVDEGTPGEPLPVTVGAFMASLNTLQTALAARAEAGVTLKIVRGNRDALMNRVRAALVSFRSAVMSKIAGNSSLIAALPRVTPEPGHTPEPVSASAVFVPPDVAEVSHSESEDSDFKEYQLRGTAGEDGDAEDAIVLATHTSQTPSLFSTQHGLGSPGGAVSLWVYVITNDGNERGSARMVIERPL